MALKAEDALAIAMKYTDEHGGGGGTSDYTSLKNKPQINNVTLTGNKTTEDLIPIGNGLNFNEDGELEVTGSETTYDDLQGKPKINNVELSGNKTSSDLGLMPEYEVDNTPTESSENLITSGAVWNADKNINDKLQGSKVVEGNPITVTDAEPINAESVIVELEPKQDLHGYDHPWVGGAGKNLLPIINTTRNVSGVDYTVNPNGTITTDGTANALSYFVLTNDTNNLNTLSNIVIPKGTTIIASSGVSNDTLHARYVSTTYFDLPNDTPFTLEDDVALVYIAVLSGVTIDEVVYSPMIRLATETDPTFEPYSNICPITGYSEVNVECNTDTYTIDLDGTKYGGTLDVTEGGYSDEWGYISGSSVSDLTSLGASTTSIGSGLFGIYFPNFSEPHDSSVLTPITDLICNELPNVIPSVQWEANANGISINNQGHIIFTVKDITTQSDMDAWLSNNPIQIAYRKKTPTSVSTTPTQIQMLENTNNISTDGTNIQLKYQPNNVIGECKAYTDEKCAKVLPQPPTTDGTYHLECSISEGVPTIRWVVNSGE